MDDVTLPTFVDNAVEVVSMPTALVRNHEDVWTSKKTLLPRDCVCHGMDPAPGIVIKESRPNVTTASCPHKPCHAHMRWTSSGHLARNTVADNIGRADAETKVLASAPQHLEMSASIRKPVCDGAVNNIDGLIFIYIWYTCICAMLKRETIHNASQVSHLQLRMRAFQMLFKVSILAEKRAFLPSQNQIWHPWLLLWGNWCPR